MIFIKSILATSSIYMKTANESIVQNSAYLDRMWAMLSNVPAFRILSTVNTVRWIRIADRQSTSADRFYSNHENLSDRENNANASSYPASNQHKMATQLNELTRITTAAKKTTHLNWTG
jgi:hypothetical protein